MKAAFYTLGCKVNQNETAALQHLFRSAGYTIAENADAPDADVYVVNSCTVTAGGDAKSRQWLRRAKRINPAAVTVLTGCFPQAFPAKAALPEADVITGTAARGALLQHINHYLATGRQVVAVTPHAKGDAFEELPAAPMAQRTRAFVKVQDGCNRRCAYCAIPLARGTSRSRRQAAILEELEALAQNGFSEVVFTGINLPSYGRDTGTNLAQLVGRAAEIEGIRRIRLSSLEPDLITAEEIAAFAACGKFCRQFHLSLQSGCTATLARMRRPYTAGDYAAAMQAIRAAMPNATFTTDVIVGFPGEDEAEFAESLAFVQQAGFLKVHVFPYSVRPGTPAAAFGGQVPKAVKAQRAKTMQQAADAVRAGLIGEQKSTLQEVLLETPLPTGQFTGYTRGYIPVLLAAPGAAQGDIVQAILGEYDGERCAARLV